MAQETIAAVEDQTLQTEAKADDDNQDADREQLWRRKEEQLREDERLLQEAKSELLKGAASLVVSNSHLQNLCLLLVR